MDVHNSLLELNLDENNFSEHVDLSFTAKLPSMVKFGVPACK